MMDERPLLSDCCEGAMHPVDSGQFWAHGEAIVTLAQALQSGRLHHGWIFSGPLGVGKATLAYHFARILLADKNLALQDNFDLIATSELIKLDKIGRLIAQFAHPDMRILRRAYDVKSKKFFSFIRIDEVRALRDMLHTTASMGGRRVILIDRAEDMNEASGNALLKLLEEPPQHTIFLFITNSIGQIPITIRSRCRVLKFQGLGGSDFQQALQQQFKGQGAALPEHVDWHDLEHLSGGSVRLGFELLEGNGLKYYQLLFKIFDGLPTLEGRLLEQFVDGVLRDKSGQDYKAAVQLMADMMHRLIKGKIAGFPLSAGEKRLSDKLIGQPSIEHWLSLWDTLLKQSLEVDEYNLDKRTYLMTCFFDLRALVRAL